MSPYPLGISSFFFRWRKACLICNPKDCGFAGFWLGTTKIAAIIGPANRILNVSPPESFRSAEGATEFGVACPPQADRCLSLAEGRHVPLAARLKNYIKFQHARKGPAAISSCIAGVSCWPTAETTAADRYGRLSGYCGRLGAGQDAGRPPPSARARRPNALGPEDTAPAMKPRRGDYHGPPWFLGGRGDAAGILPASVSCAAGVSSLPAAHTESKRAGAGGRSFMLGLSRSRGSRARP
jgi:hypothetical protein